MSRNIILLFGGESDERLVSVASAQAMAVALGSALLWFWDKKGSIYQVELEELSNHADPFIKEFIPKSRPLFQDIGEAIRSSEANNHIFVLGLHGGKGEDGSVQSLLEAAHRPYTGSDAKCSRVAFDKIATKQLLTGFPIKMAAQKSLETCNENILKSQLTEFMNKFGETVVKPVCGGSSLGCYFLKSSNQLEEITKALTALPEQAYFCEQVIKGRELTIGVFQSETGLKALPVTEIVMDRSRDFDYEGKYLGVGSKELTPADISETATAEAQKLAVTAHRALSLYGYSRTDMIMASDGIYFLEINTLPGLTKQSLVPQQLALANISMAEFLDGQIKLALAR